MQHENSWNIFLKGCALQNPNSNVMEQMSGVEFGGYNQSSRNDKMFPPPPHPPPPPPPPPSRQAIQF